MLEIILAYNFHEFFLIDLAAGHNVLTLFTYREISSNETNNVPISYKLETALKEIRGNILVLHKLNHSLHHFRRKKRPTIVPIQLNNLMYKLSTSECTGSLSCRQVDLV